MEQILHQDNNLTINDKILIQNDIGIINRRPLPNDYSIYNVILNSWYNMDTTYVRYIGDYAVKFSTLREYTSNVLNNQLNLFKIPRFPYHERFNETVLNKDICINQFNSIIRDPYNQQLRENLMYSILSQFFNENNNHTIISTFDMSNSNPNFIIRSNNKVIGIMLCRQSNNPDTTITDQIAHGVAYINEHVNNDAFLIINKDAHIGVGFVIKNFHTLNNFNNKAFFFNGYIGLQMHTDLIVRPIPQQNVFYPQVRLYNVAIRNMEHNVSVYALFNKMLNGEFTSENRNPRTIDFGPTYTLNNRGIIEDFRGIAIVPRDIAAETIGPVAGPSYVVERPTNVVAGPTSVVAGPSNAAHDPWHNTFLYKGRVRK
jgi:hypothetical protein